MSSYPPFDGSAPKQQKFSAPPEMGIDPAKRYTATMSTSMGDMVIALDPIKAPKTVNSFVFLALNHYYDGIVFHRIINGFMCQGGDPTGTGRGGPGYKFADELPRPGQYEIGSVAMANAGPEHQRQPVLPDLRPERHRPPAGLQPVRQDREGPRGARRDAECADRWWRSSQAGRRDQFGHDHRRRRLIAVDGRCLALGLPGPADRIGGARV